MFPGSFRKGYFFQLGASYRSPEKYCYLCTKGEEEEKGREGKREEKRKERMGKPFPDWRSVLQTWHLPITPGVDRLSQGYIEAFAQAGYWDQNFFITGK
jgi:hypothetical protein